MGFSSAPMVLVKIGYILHVEARLAYRTQLNAQISLGQGWMIAWWQIGVAD
jgi:hypothetical protein